MTVLLWLLGAYYVVVFLVIAALRLGYPFELEWMEGSAVDHVARLVQGQPLYVEPSLWFTPMIYTPLYFQLCAALASILGVGFFALRLVSVAATLGVLALIAQLVRRETGDGRAGLLAAGLFAATYRAGGAWFDVGRVDMLLLLLLLGAAYLLRFEASVWRAAAAGVMLALAFLTKQVALLLVLPLGLYALAVRRPWRRGLAFVAGFVVLALPVSLVLESRSGGWFSFYVFDLPRQHSITPIKLLTFWTHDMLLPLGLALLVGLGAMVRWFSVQRERFWFYAALAGGSLGVSWISRVHDGGYENVLLPGYAVVCVLFGVGLHHGSGRRFGSGLTHLLAARHLRLGLLSACVVQFVVLLYNPAEQVPRRKDRRAGDMLVARLKQIQGHVWVPSHGHLAAMAGKRQAAHRMAIEDVFRSGSQRPQRRLDAQVRAAIRDQTFKAIVLDSPWFEDVIARHYRRAGALFASPYAFWPRTGLPTRPAQLWLPR